MFETFNGLPLHPLVVHAAVVFIPLTCVGTILIAIKRSWRKSLGWWVLAIAFLSVGFAAVAKESGEALAKKIGEPLVHAQLGDTLPFIAGIMFLAVAALVLADFAMDRGKEKTGKQPVLVTILAIVAVIISIGATVQTVRVGDSGAKAVWANALNPAASPTPSGSGSAGSATYTLAQVQAHNTAADCWTTISGKVYNLTTWEDQHPGGADRIIAICGKDGTTAFADQHGTQKRPNEDLSSFQIGTLAS
ncbi:MAG: cytochrome b5-like heme/steroid binding domain-containing protein [Candidatus Nanopelagicales bacterium]|jgi:uncharacterized membrane protein